ncbi:MAG: PQQ-dependent sugar dehydrogenase, partial [Gammaproteobacteria bacterium]|nr:PQQ-dependent sugar dehydrogenase [Gammaproteobacteria bacterium]
GVVYVGTRFNGSVYALRDVDGDGYAEQKYILANDLSLPNGIAILNNTLYVATFDRLLRWKNPSQHLDKIPDPVVLVDDFPHAKGHGWRYLKAGPDGKLYMSIGAPCNICKKPHPLYATLVRMNADGGEREIVAKGVRNSLGIDWHPDTGGLFFNENGRDYLGDDIPADELNHLADKAQHFGFPYCHAGDIADEKYGKQKSCDQFTTPVWKYPAHIAPLGIHFYRGKSFPKQYHGQAFVAQHGSWNRSVPHGYRIVMLRFEQGMPVEEIVFAEGWLQDDEEVIGRPVDIIELNDGSILVSDDKRGVIYRISYEANS